MIVSPSDLPVLPIGITPGRHLLVLGDVGIGKSYLCGILAMKAHVEAGMPVQVVDPHRGRTALRLSLELADVSENVSWECGENVSWECGDGPADWRAIFADAPPGCLMVLEDLSCIVAPVEMSEILPAMMRRADQLGLTLLASSQLRATDEFTAAIEAGLNLVLMPIAEVTKSRLASGHALAAMPWAAIGSPSAATMGRYAWRAGDGWNFDWTPMLTGSTTLTRLLEADTAYDSAVGRAWSAQGGQGDLADLQGILLDLHGRFLRGELTARAA